MRTIPIFRPAVSQVISPNRTCTFRYASGSPANVVKSGFCIYPQLVELYLEQRHLKLLAPLFLPYPTRASDTTGTSVA